MTAAATTATTAATATATAARAFLGDVDAESAAFEHRAVERLDSLVGLGVRHHRHEGEATSAAGLAIGHDVRVGDVAMLGEERLERLLRRVVGKIAHIKSIIHCSL